MSQASTPFVVADQGAAVTSGVAAADRTIRTPIRYLAALTGLVAVALVGIGLGNYLLNPLAYSQPYIRQAAQALAAGKNFANYDPNINMRALRAEQIRALKTTPDIVLLGGSRWQEARGDQVTDGRTFLNAHVHNDYVEDWLALVQLLEDAGRLPRTLVLSERFATFEPLSQRDSQEWLVWAPEYRRMAQRLGVTPAPALQTLPTQEWSGMFSAPALFDRVRQLAVKKHAPEATTADQLDDLDIFAADGSLHWSRQSIKSYSGGFLKNNIRSETVRLENTAPIVDEGRVDAQGRLIEYLRSRGVQVVLALAPYQPDFYAAIHGHPYARALQRIQAVAERFSRQYGLPLIGGYDAAQLGCSPDQFRDILHPVAECLAHVMSRLPPP